MSMIEKDLNRENFWDLLWVNFSKLIGQGYAEKPLTWIKLFTPKDSDGAYAKYKEVNGFPIWEKNYEGQPYNKAQRSDGADITIVNDRYDQSYTVTWEYLEDNKEKIMGGKGISLSGAVELGRGCRVKQELSAAEIINNGFTNVGYDGVPLFATNHPLLKGTMGNTPSSDSDKTLSDANLKKAITASKKQVDNTGIKIQVNPDKLFVSDNLYFTALTIVHSALVAGTNNNDKNVISLVSPLEVIPMPYFDDNIWILKDSVFENLIFQWRTYPEFGYSVKQGTPDYEVWGRARWGVGYIDWRGLYGAKQAA